jgi:hemerythrin
MAFYKWSDRLDIGVESMNSEHKILIDKMNKLHDLSEGTCTARALKAAFDDLATYAVKHFEDEEAYMEKENYPGLAVHKAVHQRLLKQVNDHAAAIDFESCEIPEKFFDFLSFWLTSHICEIDKKYGANAS